MIAQELQTAIDLAKANCKNVSALAYLEAIKGCETTYGSDGVGVQLLYCLNNMQQWRGELARATKKTFKKYAKLMAYS